MENLIWIDPAFLNWRLDAESHSIITERKFLHLPYEYINHAEQKLRSENRFDRADAINNLKKAFYHRVEAPSDIYKLSSRTEL